nr:thioredoxin [Rubrobacter marinus]
MAVTDVTDANFESEVLQADKPVIVDFWAPWCVPCRRVSPILDEMSESREDVRFVKVNVDDNPQTAMSYSITSIPTITRFEAGRSRSRPWAPCRRTSSPPSSACRSVRPGTIALRNGLRYNPGRVRVERPRAPVGTGASGP